MYRSYLEVISLVERVHWHFLEVVKLELDRLGVHDINNVQGMMLFNIGDAEMTIGELVSRGCYLRSSLAYNLKKMVENDYLVQERSEDDRRITNVRLTEKGTKLRDQLQSMHQRHAEVLEQTDITDEDFHAASVTLDRLKGFWTRIFTVTQRAAARASKHKEEAARLRGMAQLENNEKLRESLVTLACQYEEIVASQYVRLEKPV